MAYTHLPFDNNDVTVTDVTFGTTSTVAPPGSDVKVLAWLVPVIAAIAVLFCLAVGLFYCVVKTELAIIRRCPACCKPEDDPREDVPLISYNNERYALN